MRIIAATALLLLAAPAVAQERDFSSVEIRSEPLAPGVAVLFGAGGNIGVSHGPDGTVLVDDQFAPLTERIQAAVAGLGATPARFLVNTHWHGDHTGGNENLGQAGALILAHDNVRIRMASPQTRRDGEGTPASPPAALPVVTYEDGLKLHLNGDTVHLIHVDSAHTDGDSIVRWERANVLHMGDLFFHRISLPFIDRDSGGSVQGMIAAAERGLALANDQTRIIPGHGPVATRADLAAYRDMLMLIRDRVAAAIEEGQTIEQIQAMNIAQPYAVEGGFIDGPTFVGFVHDSLINPPAHSHDGGEPHSH
ncbi:MAG: MBL fold metallo-hydrolase [Sphingomonadaceae bacterium]|nr:MBL fold metallo-hydrolase [Sphingomonadaceae bacterium]